MLFGFVEQEVNMEKEIKRRNSLTRWRWCVRNASSTIYMPELVSYLNIIDVLMLLNFT